MGGHAFAGKMNMLGEDLFHQAHGRLHNSRLDNKDLQMDFDKKDTGYNAWI